MPTSYLVNKVLLEPTRPIHLYMICGESLVVTETNGPQNLKSTYYLALHKKMFAHPSCGGSPTLFCLNIFSEPVKLKFCPENF